MPFPLNTMAYKRKITVNDVKDEVEKDPGDDGDDREIPVRYRVDRGWWSWVTHEYARYWYVLGALFLDSFWFLEAYESYLGSLVGTVMIIVLVGFVLLEIWGYTYLWKKK